MSAEDNKALITRYVDLVNKRQLDQLDSVLASNYTHHDPALPPEMQKGIEGQKQLVGMFIGGFPDLTGTIEGVVADESQVCARFSWKGTHKGELMGVAPTGKTAIINDIGMYRVENGRIVEGWVVFDAMGMMQQLGVGQG